MRLMASPPPIDLLKANHSFPGPYTFKVIIENRPDLLTEVMVLLDQELKRALSGNKTQRESSGGKHASLTLELVMTTAEEIHLVYAALDKIPGVVLIL